MNFKLWLEIYNWQPDGTLKISNYDAIPDEVWAKVYSYLKRKGYDLRGVEDTKNLLSGWRSYDGDHAEAFRRATQPQVRRERTPDEKLLTKIKRFYGLTTNPRIAGYILPSGEMLDFSGSRQGARPPFTRAQDHRNIYHFLDVDYSDGMREFGKRFGGITIAFSPDYTWLRIFKMPTQKQFNLINQIARMTDELSINLYRGGEWITKEYVPRKDFSYLKDIREFFI